MDLRSPEETVKIRVPDGVPAECRRGAATEHVTLIENVPVVSVKERSRFRIVTFRRCFPVGVPFLLAGVILCGTVAREASAQSSAFLQQQREIEEQVRRELNRDLPADQRLEVDYGGWYNFNIFLWDDGIKSSRTFRRHDLRVWGAATLDQGAHEFYARGKYQYHDFNSGDSYSGRDSDWIGPKLDRGFYQFDLRKAMRAYAEEEMDWNLKFKIGRDYVEFGTAYALSAALDHILVTAELGDIEILGLAGTTIRSHDDRDRSRPNGINSERNFYGTQISYTGMEKHRPFVYFYYTEDQLTESRPVVLFQDFDYDSWYIGLGQNGELLKNLYYSTEWVYQGGHSQRDRRLGQARIDAWAFDAMLEYLSQAKTKPRFLLEYMFASGDGDRRYSPTDTFGGNVRGDDTSFSGFGYRDTGLALAPRLSNVHVWRAGAAFRPLEEIRGLENLELGTDWFLYWKHHRHGAISDFTADRGSGYVGWEMDYHLTWRITSDLALTTRFGSFFPGKAFDDQTTRTFFLTGVTWSF